MANEGFLAARTALLTAVEEAADNLQLFHDTVENANLVVDPPARAERHIQDVIEGLTKLETDLEKVLVALGIAGNRPS